jgi:hypothetical protein
MPIRVQRQEEEEMFKKLVLTAAVGGLALIAFSAFSPAATFAADPPPAVPSVVLRGAGVLDAQGNGIAAVKGAMDLHVSASEGILLVRDLDHDAFVDVQGNGETAHWNGFTVYFGFHGQAHVIARDAAVIVVGKDIDLHVVGKGWAFLKGRGTFTANGRGPFPWTEDGAFGSVTP